VLSNLAKGRACANGLTTWMFFRTVTTRDCAATGVGFQCFERQILRIVQPELGP